MEESRRKKIVAISQEIFEFAKLLKDDENDTMADSPIIDKIIILCLKHKHASGVPLEEALSIIQKLIKVKEINNSVPENFCVEITEKNRGVLIKHFKNFNKTNYNFNSDCKYLNSNKKINYLAPSFSLIENVKVLTTEEFVKIISHRNKI